MTVLGIFDGAHDAGACVVAHGRIVAAVNEERLTRVKLQGSFPERSISEVLRVAGVSETDVDEIAVGGVLTPQLYLRYWRWLQRNYRLEEGLFYTPNPDWRAWVADFVQFRSGITSLTPECWLGRMEKRFIPSAMRRDLPPALRRKPIHVYDHHTAHAASAYYSSGLDPCLCVTADGVGDGVSFGISQCANREVKRLASLGHDDSIAVFYALITAHLGFIPFRDEGKVLGLAARGRADRVDVPFPFERAGGGLHCGCKFGLRARPFLTRLARYSMEDVAAWLQSNTESLVVDVVAAWVERTGTRQVALAGGLFANVRLNQLIASLPSVASVYVFPQMGDGGLAAGAALAHVRPEPEYMEHVFLGPAYSDREIERALAHARLPYTRPPCLEEAAAQRLAGRETVARFDGRMEYGPRALGNRSILVSAEDEAVCDRLNAALGRSRFMPFAPATPIERASQCYVSISAGARLAPFMAATFGCTPEMKRLCPAVVHVDGTARAQIVDAQTSQSFHKILTSYADRTGRPSLLNTSFNMHEEPIVCTPADAANAFRRAGLDWLAIGPFLAQQARA